MSRRVDVDEKIRGLARQHPGWTPSQIAIFLQGEQLKVTSEDVRRALARPARTEADTTDAAATTQPRYTVPREERRRSALALGILFGLLLFVATAGALVLVSGYDPNLARYADLGVYALGLIVIGALASRMWASGARSGIVAAIVHLLVSVGVGAFLFYSYRSTYTDVMGTSATQLSDRDFGYAVTVVLVVAFIIALIIVTLTGLVLGWLGAKLLGRRRRRATFG